jgi:hypothetical protein
MDLLEGGSGLAIYLGLKLGGYLLWSFAGMRWLAPENPKPIKAAIGLGFGRLVLGWIVGILVAPFALAATKGEHLPVFYFTALAVVRWFEWGVIQSLIPGREQRPVFLSGGSGQGRAWRLGGILVSYLADAPFLLTEGFPHGRLFC